MEPMGMAKQPLLSETGQGKRDSASWLDLQDKLALSFDFTTIPRIGSVLSRTAG
jgi:hypothetical protein